MMASLLAEAVREALMCEEIMRRKRLCNLERALCEIGNAAERMRLMTMNEETVVGTCHELAAGDLTVARYKGSIVHRGRASARVPTHGLFWIMDELTGVRRLRDMADLEVCQVRSAVIGPKDPGEEPSVA